MGMFCRILSRAVPVSEARPRALASKAVRYNHICIFYFSQDSCVFFCVSFSSSLD